jgi:small subunit ribosomal protein S17
MQEEQNQQETSAEAPAEVETVSSPEAAAVETAAEEQKQGPRRKMRTGVVVSDKMDKSILVVVNRRVRHPLYKKYFNKSKKLMAHDENNECGIGDTVRIVETRPMSARKRWRLEQVLEKAK